MVLKYKRLLRLAQKDTMVASLQAALEEARRSTLQLQQQNTHLIAVVSGLQQSESSVAVRQQLAEVRFLRLAALQPAPFLTCALTVFYAAAGSGHPFGAGREQGPSAAGIICHVCEASKLCF